MKATAENDSTESLAQTQAISTVMYLLDSTRDWDVHLERAAQKMGFMVHRRGDLWNEQGRRNAFKKLAYADGFRCKLIHIGGRKHAFAIRPHRFYFLNDSELPTDLPEYKLLKGQKAPSPKSIACRIRDCRNLAESLIDHGFPGLSANELQGVDCWEDLHLSAKYILAGGRAIPIDQNLAAALARFGPVRSPNNFRCIVFASAEHIGIAEKYGNILSQAFRRLNVSAHVKVVPLPRDIERNARYADRLREYGSGTIAVLGVSGKLGQPLPPAMSSFMGLLDERAVRYRLFSVENGAMQWSGFDQAGIILDSAGGTSYALDLPWPDHARNTITIGLDLGHPRMKDHSWLAASLVGPNGRLIDANRFQQPRDETIRPRTLGKIMNWIKTALNERGIAPQSLLILRDGRLFENESISDYKRHLSCPFTFADITKGPVPLMTKGDHTAPPGSAFVTETGKMAFLMGSQGIHPDHIPKPVKVHLHHDELNLGLKTLCALLASLSHAPTLGLRPTRLPSPTYWADGFAGISETDHRFSGLIDFQNK
jgi:hypothetical protein